MSNELRDIRPITGAVLGTLSLGAGLVILFIALEWIHGVRRILSGRG